MPLQHFKGATESMTKVTVQTMIVQASLGLHIVLLASNRRLIQSGQSLLSWTTSTRQRRFAWRTTRTKKKNNEWSQS
eukprot:2056315-Amphidinium_carterae.1